MNKLLNKLKNKDGVSLLFALLGFMVAASVCASITVAATSSFISVHNDRKEQQYRLNLTSAAQLLVEEFEQTKLYEDSTTIYEYTKEISEGNRAETITVLKHKVGESIGNPYLKEPKMAMDNTVELLMKNKNLIQKDVLTIKPKEEDKRINPIKVDMIMNNEYEITCTLKDENSGQEIYVKLPMDKIEMVGDDSFKSVEIEKSSHYDKDRNVTVKEYTVTESKTSYYKWGKIRAVIVGYENR